MVAEVAERECVVGDAQLVAEMSHITSKKSTVSATASGLPDSLNLLCAADLSDVDLSITENVLQSLQTSVSDGSVTTNIAVSVERCVKGSLFTWATMQYGVFNISIHK